MPSIVDSGLDPFFAGDFALAAGRLEARSRGQAPFDKQGKLSPPNLKDLLHSYTPKANIARVLKGLILDTDDEPSDDIAYILNKAHLLTDQKTLTNIGFCKALELLPLTKQVELLDLKVVDIPLAFEPKSRETEAAVTQFYEAKGYFVSPQEGAIVYLIFIACIRYNLEVFSALAAHPLSYDKLKSTYPSEYETRISQYYRRLIVSTSSGDVDDSFPENQRINALDIFETAIASINTDEIFNFIEKELEGNDKATAILTNINEFFSKVGIEKMRSLLTLAARHQCISGGWPDLTVYDPISDEIFLSEVKYKRDKLRFSQIYFYKNYLKNLEPVIKGMIIAKPYVVS